jgi:hypothetical protein
MSVAPVFLLYGTHVPFTPYFKIRFWVLLQNLTHDLLAVDVTILKGTKQPHKLLNPQTRMPYHV